MSMLGTVLTHLQQLGTSLTSNVQGLIQLWRSKLTGALTTIKTLYADSSTNLWFLRVQIRLKFKAFLAQFTTLASSTKAEPIPVAHNPTVPGRQRARTARKTRQLAKRQLKKDN